MSKSALKHGEEVARHSMFHLIVLGTVKLATGFFTGLTVVIADGISTFADTLGVFASWLGLKLSQRSADKNFEYGYYKIETFMALIISLGIIYLGVELFMKSLETIENPSDGQFVGLGILITIGAIIHAYRMYKKLSEAGEKVNSLSLIASAKDKKMDIIAGIAIIASILANQQGIPYVEGIISMIISLIVFRVGIITAKESLFFLLDYWNDPILKRKIRSIFLKEKDLIIDIKKLRLRRAGTFIFGEAFVEINPFAGIQDLREELDFLQEYIKDLNPYIKDFSIYSHITRPSNVKIAIPYKSGKGLNAKLATSLKETKGFVFVELKNNQIKKTYSKKVTEKQKKTVSLADFLVQEKINILIDNDLNSLVYYNLRRTHHILIYPNFSDINNVEDTVKLLLIDT